MSYKNPVPLDFSSFDIACLCGFNGAGKSSILEAITWVIWNKARSTPDSLIHHGEQAMWVDFEFEQSGKRYRIIRKRSKKGKGSSELDFLVYEQGWISLAGATIKETEEKIAQVIKLPYEIFVNSAYLRQGKADEFTTQPAYKRKEILGKILDLDFYEQLSERAKEKIKIHEAEEQALTASLNEIEENLKQKPIFEKEFKEVEKSLKEAERNLKNEQEQLEKLQQDKNKYDLLFNNRQTIEQQMKSIEEEGKELKEELDSEKEKLKEIENLLKNKEEIEKGFEKLTNLKQKNEEYNQKLSELSKYQENLGVLKARKEEVQNKINRINAIDKCPTCLRELSKQEAAAIIKNLKEKEEKQIIIQLQKIKKLMDEIGYDKIVHQKIRNEISQLNHFEEEKRRIDIESKALSEKKETIRKIEKNIDKKRKDYIQLLNQHKKFNQQLETLKPINDKYSEQKSKVDQLFREFNELKVNYGAFKQRLLEINKQEELYKLKKEKLKEIKKEIIIYKQLHEIFSKKGLQAMIIEKILPEIEVEANKILEKITDGKMRIRFITSKEKKSGQGEMETLEIKIADNLGERGYEVYSGGEAFRIDLSVRVALSKVLSKRAGTKLQFLAIDEGFGSLDEAGKDEVVDAINSLKGDFEKILVVTHLNELKNLFPARIEVNKDEQGSHLEIFNV